MSLAPLNGMGTLHKERTQMTKYDFHLVPTNYKTRFNQVYKAHQYTYTKAQSVNV